jgi:hypothetical protein
VDPPWRVGRVIGLYASGDWKVAVKSQSRRSIVLPSGMTAVHHDSVMECEVTLFKFESVMNS